MESSGKAAECESCESIPEGLVPDELDGLNKTLAYKISKGLDAIRNHYNLYNCLAPDRRQGGDHGSAKENGNLEFTEMVAPKEVQSTSVVGDRGVIKRMLNIIYLLGFLDLYAVSMVITMLPLHIKVITGEVTMMGILGSIYGCIQICSGPLIGSLCDKQGRKFGLCVCLLPTCFSYLILSFSSQSSDSNVLFLLIGRIIAGVFKHSQTVCRAYLADITPPEQKARVFGRFNAYSSLGFVFGPLTGGYYLEKFDNGFQVICCLAAGIFFLMFVLASYLLTEVLPDRDFLSMFGKKRAKLVEKNVSWNSSQFYKIQLLRFLLSSASLIFRFTFTFQLQNTYNLPSQNIGIIIAFQGVLSALTGFFTGHLYKVYGDLFLEFLHVTIVYTITLATLSFLPPFECLISLQIPLIVCASFLRVIFTHLITLSCPSEHLGNALGIGATVISISRSMSPLMSTAMYNYNPYCPGIAAAVSSALGLLCGWQMFFREDFNLHAGKFKTL